MFPGVVYVIKAVEFLAVTIIFLMSRRVVVVFSLLFLICAFPVKKISVHRNCHIGVTEFGRVGGGGVGRREWGRQWRK